MAKCKECYHYSACFEMAKINLQMCGISDYDGNADGCKDFIAAENVVVLNPERTIATKLPAQTKDPTYGGYQKVYSFLDIPAAKAKMIEDIKARIEQIYSANDSWFIKLFDGDGDDDAYYAVGWKLTVGKPGQLDLDLWQQLDLLKQLKSLHWDGRITAAGALYRLMMVKVKEEDGKE